MPQSTIIYDAVYCYSLILLLNESERKNIIENCFRQLQTNGLLIFVALSNNDKRYGQGKETAKNTFLFTNGLHLCFYDEKAIYKAFENYNINEPEKIKMKLVDTWGFNLEKALAAYQFF